MCGFMILPHVFSFKPQGTEGTLVSQSLFGSSILSGVNPSNMFLNVLETGEVESTEQARILFSQKGFRKIISLDKFLIFLFIGQWTTLSLSENFLQNLSVEIKTRYVESQILMFANLHVSVFKTRQIHFQSFEGLWVPRTRESCPCDEEGVSKFCKIT